MAIAIQPLPTEVVHLIAAGEVIDSLAAVVRELAENALDAGATRITISLWSEQWRIRVADNGSGMDLYNLKQAASPHSTSKIHDSADLWKITSLGFRGEALHSLAQLADLEICSRPDSSDRSQHLSAEGWRVIYNTQGEPVRVETAAIAPGTIVTASNLFNTIPTRRQGLPSAAQQLRAVQTTIHQLALCHPHVTWQIEQSDRSWFTIWSATSAKQILPQLLREIQLSDLQELTVKVPNFHTSNSQTIDSQPSPYFSASLSLPSSSSSSPSCQISLTLGLPDRCHRRRPDWVRVAVNGRLIKSPELEQTILGAFRQTLPRDRYPICFLHLQVPPDQIDWNRHPAKAEIYLHELNEWQTQVVQAINQALRLGPAHLPETAYSKQLGKLLKAAEAQGGYNVSRSIQVSPSETEAETEPDQSRLSSHSLLPLKALAQVHNMYILAEHPAGMWLVEQHIAHERVLYEQLCDRWQLVPLEPPIILNNLSAAQLEQLQRIGLEVETFGDQLWAIRTAPELLMQRDDCADALLELSLGGDLQSALVAVACRTAIRNGTTLNLQEMQTLLDQWKQCSHPRTCPHGRPIYLPLEESSLSRFFRRHWVIGKSHGI